jgi:hypothetical protein
MEVKSTYEVLRDARVAELAKMFKPVEAASNVRLYLFCYRSANFTMGLKFKVVAGV